ncbi:hypothetical protein [Nostoc sp. MS1]|uniref:hypothetical protein n=1 Tax=Nostoc sp. MS1 TaxID=2764711 RepID=UPI001CC430A3|nr:hypothetical protein [Nostoc sp. MS1]BCL36817.1 hypothetical protein NSMS1_32640 [Nostoc sp. MS1]
MIAFIFSRLIGHTFLSIFVAVIFGSIIGLVVGAIRRRIQDTIYVSIVGSFLGSILVCIIPPITTPGSLEGWGVGSGLGSIVVLFTFFFIALGGIVGSFITTTFAFGWFLKLKTKWFLWIVGGLYMMMLISLIYNHLMYCSSSISSSFCYTK